jgi:hypothetical protein
MNININPIVIAITIIRFCTVKKIAIIMHIEFVAKFPDPAYRIGGYE